MLSYSESVEVNVKFTGQNPGGKIKKTRIEKVIHTDTNIQFNYSELNAVTNISQ